MLLIGLGFLAAVNFACKHCPFASNILEHPCTAHQFCRISYILPHLSNPGSIPGSADTHYSLAAQERVWWYTNGNTDPLRRGCPAGGVVRVDEFQSQKPAPVVEKPPVKPTPPPKGGETGSTSSYRGEKPTTPLAPGTAESTTGNEAQKPAPTPSPAPVGATTINGSKSNNYREEKPTTPPASVIAPTPTPAPTTPVKPVKKKPHHGLLKVW